MKAVIMAGGKGTRFWPKSTEVKPKQFLRLTSSQETMLQLTYRRFTEWLPKLSVYIVTTKQYVHMVQEQLPELPPDRIILEPDQRDTGPCIALTALHFLRRSDDEVLVVSPSDHYIPDGEALKTALDEAVKTAEIGRNIVTLGIVPTRPETGYGYIEAEGKAPVDGKPLPVKAFIEKPSREKAEVLFRRERVYWNSGLFVWKPSTIAYYMKLHQKEIWDVLEGAGDDIEPVYQTLPKISVDYAILEKADRIYTMPVSFEWDDVGSWTSLERIHLLDESGNILIGDVHAAMTSNSIVFTENQRTIVIGVEDLIIVSTDDGLLISRKTHEQQIKKVLEGLRREKEDRSG